VEEFVADETSEPNESVSVDQNEISMINNINTETENNVFKWLHEAILKIQYNGNTMLLVEEYRKRAEDFYSGRISQQQKIGKI